MAGCRWRCMGWIKGDKLPTEHGRGRWQKALGAMSGRGGPTAGNAATQWKCSNSIADTLPRIQACTTRRTEGSACGPWVSAAESPRSLSACAASSISCPLLFHFPSHQPLTQTFCPHRLDSLSQNSPFTAFFSSPLPTTWGKWTSGEIQCVTQGWMRNKAFSRGSPGELLTDTRNPDSSSSLTKPPRMTRSIHRQLYTANKTVNPKRNTPAQLTSSHCWFSGKTPS